MPPSPPHHPVVVEHAARRAADIQLRIADAITAFAGSMPFVYIHAVAFACWMLFVESDPWPKLTLIVSLEAIFLSTFVMIGQNRQAEFQRAKADHDFASQEQELRLNTEITREIHTLTTELHGHVLGARFPQDQLATRRDDAGGDIAALDVGGRGSRPAPRGARHRPCGSSEPTRRAAHRTRRRSSPAPRGGCRTGAQG